MIQPPKPPDLPEGVAHKLVQTPLDAQGKLIEREELRKAAGGERLPSLDGLSKLYAEYGGPKDALVCLPES